MASDTGRGSGRIGARASSRTPVDQKIVPNSGWTEDSAGHCLLVDLPGIASNTGLSFEKKRTRICI